MYISRILHRWWLRNRSRVISMVTMLLLVTLILYISWNVRQSGQSHSHHMKRRRPYGQRRSPGLVVINPLKWTAKKNTPHLKIDLAYKRQFQKLLTVVHLDLKGAAPRIDYLKKVLPLMARLGAKGILLEYEDMFPYHGDLGILATKNAYSKNDIKVLKNVAKRCGLQIIPLVQTFGHLEFVLKHERFKELRENPDDPRVITPTKSESYQLLQAMIDQVIQVHPDIKFLHIGSDEVYDLGRGKSREVLQTKGISKDELFLGHVKTIAKYVKRNYPRVQPIMWDDEMRQISLKNLQKSGVGKLVEPMMWYYKPAIWKKLPENLWKKYGQVFRNVWIASSFKGATGISQYVTDATYHLRNHFSWVHTIKSYADIVHFRGVALTGWQRYNHFAPLCELLPVTLPSLSVCLLTITKGGFNNELHWLASKMLNCSRPLDLELPAVNDGSISESRDCTFPGSFLYYETRNLFKSVHKLDALKGSNKQRLTEYVARHGMPKTSELKQLTSVLRSLRAMYRPMKTNLEKIFIGNTSEEWLKSNLENRMKDLQNVLKKY